MLVGPEGEGKGGEIVDDGDSVAVLGEVDGAEVELAGVAGLDAYVGKLLGDVDGQLVFGFFAASGAEKASKIPLAHAKGAEETALAAVPFETKRAKHWQGSATRADARCGGGLGHG